MKRVALLLVVVVAALCFGEEQPLYNVGGKSCYACPPGYKLIEECPEDGTASTCDVCPHNTYMLGWNLERNCKMKPPCPTNQRILHHDPRSSTYVCGCAVGEHINATINRCEPCPIITCPECSKPKDCPLTVCPPTDCSENNIKNEVRCDCPQTSIFLFVIIAVEFVAIVVLILLYRKRTKPHIHIPAENKTPLIKGNDVLKNGYKTTNEKMAILAQDDDNDDLLDTEQPVAGEQGNSEQNLVKVFVDEPPLPKDEAEPDNIRKRAIELVCDIIETQKLSDEEFKEIAPPITNNGQYRVLYIVLNEHVNPIRTLMSNVERVGRQDLINLIRIKILEIGYSLEEQEPIAGIEGIVEGAHVEQTTSIKQPIVTRQPDNPATTIESAMEEISRIIVKNVSDNEHPILYHVYRLEARQINRIKSENPYNIDGRLVAGFSQFRETYPNAKVEDIIVNLREINRKDIAEKIVQTMKEMPFQLDVPPEENNEVDIKFREACRSLQRNIGIVSPKELFNYHFGVPIIQIDLPNEELAHKYLENWKQMNGQNANTEKLLSALRASRNLGLYKTVVEDLEKL